jgi:hypothetical protein
MPISFDAAHRRAMATVKANMVHSGRTEWTGEDYRLAARLVGYYTEKRGAEDEIRYSDNGMNQGPMEDFCR